jgi:hypothetical protein
LVVVQGGLVGAVVHHEPDIVPLVSRVGSNRRKCATRANGGRSIVEFSVAFVLRGVYL